MAIDKEKGGFCLSTMIFEGVEALQERGNYQKYFKNELLLRIFTQV